MKDPTINADEWRAGIDEVLEKSAENYQARNRPWTERDSAVVARYYNRVDIHMLAERLNRSPDSIRKKHQSTKERGTS